MEKMEDGEEVLIPNIKMPKIIDQSRLKRYEQSRKDLGDLFSKLKVYTIFAIMMKMQTLLPIKYFQVVRQKF